MVFVLDKNKASSRVETFDDDSMFDVISSAPVTFVTGKGGVGKTTVASLLSQSASKHGERVLLVSLYNDATTQELFGIDADIQANDVTNTKLDNVEFVLITPASALTSYLASNKLGALTSKLTSSGLLESVASIIPGMRELLVVGDIRSKSESGNWDRIIVDTPSTGHAGAIFSIADVASSTAKTGVIKDQAVSARKFLEDKSKSQIIVVTLDHVMPLSECREFIYSIDDAMSINIAGIVINRSNVVENKGSKNIDRELEQIYLPLFALPPLHQINKPRTIWPFRRNTLPKILCSDLGIDNTVKTVIMLGTGGVGKTTSSAALAIAKAKQNNRVALITIDPARRLGTALGLENSKTNESYLYPQTLTAAKDSKNSLLHIFQLDSRKEFMSLLEKTLSKKEYKKAKMNTFVQGVSRAGIINEFMAIESIHRLSTSGNYDLVIVDTPPTHNVFDLINTPSALQKVFASPIFKALVSAGSIAGLGANITLKTFFRPLRLLLGTVLINDTIAFLKMMKDVESIFSNHVDEVSVILKSANTKYIGISRPDLTSREQIMTVAREMRARGFGFSSIILNGLNPEEFNIDGEMVPFAQDAQTKGITVKAIPTFEHNQPVEIVKDMSKDIV